MSIPTDPSEFIVALVSKYEQKYEEYQTAKRAGNQAVMKTLEQYRYAGMHTRYAGLNDAFRTQFPNENVIEITQKLVEEGKLFSRPSKGGVLLRIKEFAERSRITAAQQLLNE